MKKRPAQGNKRNSHTKIRGLFLFILGGMMKIRVRGLFRFTDPFN